MKRSAGRDGLELDRALLRQQAGQLSKQKRLVETEAAVSKECVDGSAAPPGGAEATGLASESEDDDGGADGDLIEEPRLPHVEASTFGERRRSMRWGVDRRRTRRRRRDLRHLPSWG